VRSIRTTDFSFKNYKFKIAHGVKLMACSRRRWMRASRGLLNRFAVHCCCVTLVTLAYDAAVENIRSRALVAVMVRVCLRLNLHCPELPAVRTTYSSVLLVVDHSRFFLCCAISF